MKFDHQTGDVQIVIGRQTAAVIVVGKHASELERLAASELVRYVEKLAYARLDVVDYDDVAAGDDRSLLLVGKPGTNPLIDEALGDARDPRKLKAEGFVLHTGVLDGRPAVVISGVDEIGTLYAAYALIERLGATFLLTGDLLPEPVDNLTLDPISETREPAFPRRGFIVAQFNLHTTIYDLDDYRKCIDQMVKLRLNDLTFFHTHCAPWIEYSYRGEKNLLGDVTSRETGYLRMKMADIDFSTAQVKIGKEHFADRRYMAPKALQDVPSQQEAVARYSHMLHEVFAHAKKRGISVGLAFDSNTMAPNFARFARKHGPRPHDGVYGSHASPTDPVPVEIAERLLDAIVDTYPEIDYLVVYCSEDYVNKCAHPDSLALCERMRPHYTEALDTVQRQWSSLCRKFDQTPEEIIDTDIGMVEVAQRILDTARRRYPHLRVGMGFWFRGYLLPSADKLIDRDVMFQDWQSSGVFPLEGDCNAEYFAGMRERERTVVVRVDDDGSMFGMPFYLRQYQTDGLFDRALAAGVTGFCGNMFRARGTEHHTRFLSEASWEPSLTPEAFYTRYASDLFGAAAAPLITDAFRILEDNEQELGWRGMYNMVWGLGCSDLGTATALMAQKNPFDGPEDPRGLTARAEDRASIFARSVSRLSDVLDRMEKAEPHTQAKGKTMLAYLTSKTHAYSAHLEMIVLLNRAFLAYARPYIDGVDDEESVSAALDDTVRLIETARQKSRDCAQELAEHIDHPNDLAILFLANVWNVNKMEEVLDHFRLVANYHRGQPYWKEAARSVDDFQSNPI